MADYVFAPSAPQNDGTRYEDTRTVEDSSGDPKEVGTPYTSFTVQVLNNIKGELQTTNPITLIKHGGVSQGQKAVYVYENDQLPQENATYIFLTYAQPDGSLLVSGPNSNISVDTAAAADAESVEESDVYQTYKEAYENEVVPVERERYTSTYAV